MGQDLLSSAILEIFYNKNTEKINLLVHRYPHPVPEPSVPALPLHDLWVCLLVNIKDMKAHLKFQLRFKKMIKIILFNTFYSIKIQLEYIN